MDQPDNVFKKQEWILTEGMRIRFIRSNFMDFLDPYIFVTLMDQKLNILSFSRGYMQVI